ncbi:hepatocyte growth factor-regulated tyrosine kinase substrate [Melitaea cinxia]|uniref:hepatocyte growth factor-regulated tyrosine kinase substrate n=1 Tax=Melitaea cinxia TaxID=113334 RepID=UPI001E272A8B|nr:hepatocyte growth factor-regulated tyrosine kinase substrate [Melitaea cinxia]
MFRANNFDKLLDKATSNLRLDPDWPSILQICDLIRQNDCSPKYAVVAVKKKLYSQNPHQAMFALLVLESIVKNCGSGVHDEVASKAFCEMLRDLVKSTQHENLKTKILELIQAWAFAFRNNPKYRAVQDTVNILKAEGHKFPPLKESDAMFSADTAPEWADGEVCHRCRTAFTLMVRRHHCRACGQVFCQQCSSKTSTLPKFGIEKEVRVCDACFDKVSRPPSSTAKLEIIDTASDYGSTPVQVKFKRPGKSAEELQEEEELQLALALSQSEAEHKEKERKSRSYIAPETTLHPTIPSPSTVSASPEHAGSAPELSRYLDRGYWEQRQRESAAPTAPSHAANDAPEQEFSKPSTTKGQVQDDEAEDKEIDEFIESLKSQVEIFVNRMKSNSSRGRSIANDTSVQTLFMNITAMHSKLLRYIQQQDDKRVYLESLQDKITQVRDSRAALDTLRAEHAARLAAAAEAAERTRQLQMAAKLQALRRKKHDYLQYQRQLALQRVQEQEREMQIRQEQQKHQYMMSANSGFYMPGVSMHQYQPGYPNQPVYASPQFHPQMIPQPTTDGSLPMPGQPQMSQANIPMNVNQMGTISQSMPQMTNTYAMSTSGVALSQPPTSVQAPMNQPNIRPMGQQIPLQQQMMMQQMQQMRLSSQPGVHQIVPPNVPNGLPGQNIPQQNPQSTQQLPKQNVSNHSQPTNPMMPPMTIGQSNMSQQNNPSNPMYPMQMPNMRMPFMHNNQPNNNQQIPVSGYPMNVQNPQSNQQAQTQIPHIGQMPLPGQPMPMPGQPMIQNQTLPGQNQQLTQVPQMNQNQGQQISQSQPQMSQGQTIPMQGHPAQAQGQQGMMQGQPMQHQGQNMQQPNQNNMTQNQQMPPNSMMANQQGQQMGPMQQISQHNILPGSMPQQPPQMQGQVQQQVPNQGQQQQQGMPQNMQGQPMKVQQNFGNNPPNQQPAVPNQQVQQVQTPVKSEHNNNTAELISFD